MKVKEESLIGTLAVLGVAAALALHREFAGNLTPLQFAAPLVLPFPPHCVRLVFLPAFSKVIPGVA